MNSLSIQTPSEQTKLTVLANQIPIYNIVTMDCFNPLREELKALSINNSKVCIVSDSNVSKLYLDEITVMFKEHVEYVNHYVFPAGEDSKNLDTVKALYEQLILAKFDRNDILVALGGGVVGDLTGYTAATYLRGIRFIQIPTSLLAMVDSSIGGKTGVDFNAYKNMVGAFHQPQLVYINIAALNTLSAREYYSGYGEVIKYGLIKDCDFYQWLIDNREVLLQKDPTLLNTAVYESCVNKKIIVEKDPTEKGDRALLNFGHTIGHAIEKLMNFKLLHGECVAIGMAAASFLSYKKGHISEVELHTVINTLQEFNLPTSVQGLDENDILMATKNDKKMAGNKIKFVLLHDIGNAVVDDTVTDGELLEAIQYILQA